MFAIAILLGLAFGNAARAGEGEDFIIYESQGRTADELKAAAMGVVNGARISTMNNKVVIYGTPSQRAAVLRLFGELDHQLKNYTVKLRVASRGNSHRDASAVQAGVNGRNVILRKKSGVLTGQGTGTVGVGNESGSVSVSAESQDSAGEDNGDQQVTVMDGGTASLYAGSVYSKTLSVHLRAIGKSGAHVEIREADSNSVGQQAIVTSLDVPLGEWRTVGGVGHVDSSNNTEILGKAKHSSLSSQDVQVRVDVAAEQ